MVRRAYGGGVWLLNASQAPSPQAPDSKRKPSPKQAEFLTWDKP